MLLTSGVVITVLVYPALFIQLNNASHSSALTSTTRSRGERGAWSFSNSNNPIYGSIAPPVREVWEGHDALRLRDEATVVARCGLQSTVAIERLFVRGYGDDSSVGVARSTPLLPGPVAALREAERMLNEIATNLQDSQSQLLNCVKDLTVGQCFITSPIATWKNLRRSHTSSESHPNLELSSSESDEVYFRRALSNPEPVASIPLHVQSLVAGQSNSMSSSDNEDDDVANDPEFLVITFAFKVDAGECQSTARHSKWVELVKGATGPNGLVSPTALLPELFALEVCILSYDLSL